MEVITDDDVRAAYAKLRELMNDATPPNAKRAEIEAQVKIIDNFCDYNQNPNNLERYAEMALAEGHVELFEKAADWCKLTSVKRMSELGPWRQCLSSLYTTLNFRCDNSIKLANRLAKSKQYFEMEEVELRLSKDKEINLILHLQNNLIHLNVVAPDAKGLFRVLYPLILEVYTVKTSEEVRVIALMILSQLSTEKEATDLMNESAQSLLVSFLAKSVHNKLIIDDSKWAAVRRTYVIRTLEKMINSDECVASLLKLDILEILGKVLNAPYEYSQFKTDELRATLTSLWTISQKANALQLIARNASLVKAIERFSKQSDQQQAMPAKNILESIKKIPSLAAAATAAQPTSKSMTSATPAPAPATPVRAAPLKTVAPATLVSLLTATAVAPDEGTPSSEPNKAVGVTSSHSNVASCNQKIRKDSIIQRVGDKSAPVFLSYQSAFTVRVLQLKRALEARGIPCWMASEDLVGNAQDAIGKVLMVTPAIIICYSQSYRESKYCKAEANMAFRLEIPMIAVCVQEGYEADYWLFLIISAAPGQDCSTDALLTGSMDRLEKELRAAHRERKPDVLSTERVEERTTESSAHAEATAAHQSNPIAVC